LQHKKGANSKTSLTHWIQVVKIFDAPTLPGIMGSGKML